MNYIVPIHSLELRQTRGTRLFWIAKRGWDIFLALVMLPFVASLGCVILSLNARYNPGPLLYSQIRMGRFGQSFRIYKFRTMAAVPEAGRTPRFAVEETDRISRMGRLLRRSRIDELPQVYNVLRGEMSFIGPRPEQVTFAEEYMRTLPLYHHRHVVRPGLSGLAQIKLGYTADTGGTRKKLDYDLQYISKSGFRMEGYILWRTLITVTTGAGSA